MAQRILYFVLGLLFTCTLFVVFLHWDANHDYYWKEKSEKAFAPKEKKAPMARDLVGTWRGKTSWGVVYTITRNGDGTFSEVADSSHADVVWHPPVVQSKGRWSLEGAHYAYYYTQSTNSDLPRSGPVVHDIEMQTPSKLTYTEMEGDLCTEEKQ